MYKFPYFTEEDQEKVIAFMKENAFAVVTGIGEQYPVASHLPLNFETREEKIFLTGHLMKNTDHHKAFVKNKHVLVVFNGPHCFVTADWYKDPLSGSTWNYMTVHAKGKISFTDEAGTIKAVNAITNKYVGTGTRGSFDKLPESYINSMVKAIVGFEIEITSFDNVFKLSQNRDEEDRANIIKKLKERGDRQSLSVAEEMEKRISNG
ncbi:MAG: FMN-binding negative transcriptional regulator [Ferruginibacter sp.]